MKKKLLSRFSSMKGFTMIELLVVIAVIGVLAVAVLSAINPIEQINKGKDTRTRSDAAELLGSIERYYSTQEQFPWNVSSSADAGGTTIPANAPTDGGTPDIDPAAAFLADATAGTWNFMGSLVESNEVKPTFGQRLYTAYSAQTATEETFVAVKAIDSDAVHVCFLPSSRQFKLEAAKRCCANTTTAGICTSAGTLAGLQDMTAVNGFVSCANVDGSNWELNTTRNFICLP